MIKPERFKDPGASQYPEIESQLEDEVVLGSPGGRACSEEFTVSEDQENEAKQNRTSRVLGEKVNCSPNDSEFDNWLKLENEEKQGKNVANTSLQTSSFIGEGLEELMKVIELSKSNDRRLASSQFG